MDRLPLGTYQPGETVLHRLDPRLKLLFCGLLIVLTFAASGLAQWVVILAATSLVLFFSGQGPVWVLHLLWPFRWLFVFTIVLHSILSPGYTLFGVAWLSRDGLIRGNLVCTQVGVALLLASLLALTTPPERLSRAFGWYFAPLARFGLPVRSWEGLMLITLRFIPILRERLAILARRDAEERATGFRARWLCMERWERRLEILVEELVVQADQMAQRIVTKQDRLEPERLTPLRALSGIDAASLVAGSILVLVYWGIGRV